MQRKDFLIHYTVYALDGSIIKTGKVKAKNKMTKFEAQCGFEEHLKKKYINFGKLVIHSCKDQSLAGMFEDIFKSKNPFGW